MWKQKKLTIPEEEFQLISQQINEISNKIHQHYDESFCSALYLSLKDCKKYISKCLDSYKEE